MNVSTAEKIIQEDLDLAELHRRIEVIKKKCEDQENTNKKKLPPGFYLDEKSLWYQAPTPDAEDKDPPPRLRICSRLEITAITRNQRGEDFGRLLEWYDCDGRSHTWAMSMSMLAGDGTAYRAELLSKGLEIEPGKIVRQKLTVYIQSSHPTARVLCTPHIGWHNDCYVLPSFTIGNSDKEKIIHQPIQVIEPFSKQGNLSEWQQLSKLCSGNSRLIFALSTAFAAPLLTPLGIEGGGIHFKGLSSLGKTTLLKVAASAWGGKEFLLTWNTTINGLEGVAMNRNDSLLCLDEIGQGDPEKVGESSYSLANGIKKGRSDSLGYVKPAAKWRLLYLSTGEHSLADQMMLAGKKAHAGQEIRILDIPADTEIYGAFENLHGHSSGDAFSKTLENLSQKYFGHAAIRFIENLINNKDHINTAKKLIKQFEQECLPLGASGQVSRGIRRFAVIAAGGELATAMGITGWTKDEAWNAAKTCFHVWLKERGGIGSLEVEYVKNHVRHYFEMHGESRFVDIETLKADLKKFPNDEMPKSVQKIHNRVGFKECDADETTYYFLPEAFQKELCIGYSKKHVEQVCLDQKWLIQGNQKVQIRKRLPGIGLKWVYKFSNRVLSDDE